jgi:hypothetical protein
MSGDTQSLATAVSTGSLGIALVGFVAWRAPVPLALGAGLVLLALAVLVLRRRSQGLRKPIELRELRVGSMTLLGIWVALYLVFALADQGSDASATVIPMRLDGETGSPGSFLLYGALGTIGVSLLLLSMRPRSARRRRSTRAKRD